VRSSAAPDVKVQWKADAGLLLYDDLPEVEWRAPTRAGSCTLWVTLSLAKETLQTSVKVDVKSPSTEGMVFVPRGTFLRGDVRGTANKAEIKTLQNSSDEPCHSVYLDDYYIDRLLVTNQEYKEFLEDSLARGLARVEDIAVTGEFDGSWVPFYYFRSFEDLIPQYHETRNARKPEFLHEISWDGSKLKVKAGKESCPVVDVSWFGAAAYAHFHGKSLPTEAQWEKAARGTDGRRYPWGNNLPTSYHANLNSQAGAEPTPVGNYSPAGDSPYGAADMLGGLFEWTNDWFNADYYSDYLGEAPFRNPAGPFWGRSHTIRGAPLTLQFPQAPSDSTEAVSFRYSWRFEFFIADIFGNRQTGFRTVVVAGGSR
jgi:formylglycine-generating enzyme required for sulfatase activity